jgi:hypothetical protein
MDVVVVADTEPFEPRDAFAEAAAEPLGRCARSPQAARRMGAKIRAVTRGTGTA